MMLDKVSMQLLDSLYYEDLSGVRVNEILDRVDVHQPDERLQILLANRLISYDIDGEEDGEGGWIDETVTYTYKITAAGRAFVEQRKKENGDKWFDRLSNFFSFP